MVEIIAIIRRDRVGATKDELKRAGCAGSTQFPVLGRGLQRGLQTHDRRKGVPFLPKVLFDIVVDDARAQETIEAVIRANQTGEFGDGRIFVIDVGDAYRISTGAQEPARQPQEIMP